MSISRRDILKSLTMTAITGSVLRVIPLEAAEYAHRMVRAERAAAEDQVYAPKFFSAHFYKTLQSLCQTIIPSDSEAKGAIEAGAPEFIDLITSENKDYQVALGGGLMWLDNTCIDRYGSVYLDCTAQQQKEILDLIAYRKNFRNDPSLGQGIEFFAFLRKLTADGFFTSEIGIEYLGYIGNTYLKEFPGCPPVPGLT
ncbi:MAG: gluconate 2-dehydrogenase subunit 3 family protein [Candidatus Sulfotelmatobacter sp.]|jgi:gluconate 2-dehydrogenase subunit 3-like protein